MQSKRPMRTPEQRPQVPQFHTKEEYLEYRRRVLFAKEAKRRKKAEKRKRIILACAAVVVALLLVAVMIATFVNRSGDTPHDTGNFGENTWGVSGGTGLSAADTQQTQTDTTEEATTEPPETEPIYDGENIVAATPITPYTTEATQALSNELISPYMLLIRAEDGEILAEKSSDTVIFPASLTKLMTVLVAYEQNKDLTKTFRITQAMIDPLYLDGLALAGFKNGEEITLHDLIYASALPSAAEASMGLALATAGSEEAFVALMNDRAKSLGMTNTHFENCTGTHHYNHVSTARDIAILLAYIFEDPFLSEVISTKKYITAPTSDHPEGVTLLSTVFTYMNGEESGTCTVLGGKTGYTIPAGRCLATAAKHNETGELFICVIAGGAERKDPVTDTIKMYQAYATP